MALTKKVNGIEVVVSAEEEQAILAQWAANDPEKAENKIPRRLEKIAERKQKLLNSQGDNQQLTAVIARTLLAIIDNDQGRITQARNKLQRIIDLDDEVKAVMEAIEADKDAVIDPKWEAG